MKAVKAKLTNIIEFFPTENNKDGLLNCPAIFYLLDSL